MQFKKLFFISMFSVLFGGSCASANPRLNVNCKELDDLLGISERASKFERVDGQFLLNMKLIDVSKYGVDVSIPKPKYGNAVQLPLPSTGIRFLPEGESLRADESIGVTVLFSTIIDSSKDDLKSMLSKEDYSKYSDIGVFDFLVKSLGKEHNGFDCDKQGKAVSMYVASVVFPPANSDTYVYYLPDINALILVPKDESVQVVQFIYPKGADGLVYVFIGGEVEMRKSIIKALNKIE